MNKALLGKLKTRIPEARAPVTARTVAACLSPQNKINQNHQLMMVGSCSRREHASMYETGSELSTCIQDGE